MTVCRSKILCSTWIGVLFLLTLALPSHAGERITPSFRVDAKLLPEVLPHVGLKAVVAEFLDPLDTGIGKTLSFLLRRETLTAISDQSGAGVILAHTPGDERLVEMLELDYHLAAVQIAKEQRGRMVLWGAAIEEDDQVLVNTYLTLLTGTGESDLSIHYEPELSEKNSGRFEDTVESLDGDIRLSPVISATIPRSRFNFGLVAVTRNDLFRRVLVTRRRANLRQRPDQQSALVRQVPPLTVLQAIDMHGGWFKLQLQDNRFAYVSHSLVDVPPRLVEANRNHVNLRSGSGTDHPVIMTGNLSGAYPVRNMRYRDGHGLWYQIQYKDRPVWIWAGLVRPRFTIPAVHFIAGLYHFYGKRYPEAVKEFEQFVSAPDVNEDNVNLASAYQMIGASRMSIDETAITREPGKTFTQAIHNTPYDPSAYLLRAVSNLGQPEMTKHAIDDLERALELDDRDKDAHTLAAALVAVASGQARPLVNRLTSLDQYLSEIRSIMRKYPIPQSTTKPVQQESTTKPVQQVTVLGAEATFKDASLNRDQALKNLSLTEAKGALLLTEKAASELTVLSQDKRLMAEIEKARMIADIAGLTSSVVRDLVALPRRAVPIALAFAGRGTGNIGIAERSLDVAEELCKLVWSFDRMALERDDAELKQTVRKASQSIRSTIREVANTADFIAGTSLNAVEVGLASELKVRSQNIQYCIIDEEESPCGPECDDPASPV